MTDNETQEQIETAAEGPVHEFHRIKLHPFSFDRNACWQRLGYEDFESQFEALIAIVFLCTLGSAAEWELIDGCRGPEKLRAMRQRIGQWAQEHKINGNSDAGVECQKAGTRIWNEMSSSRFALEAGAESPN